GLGDIYLCHLPRTSRTRYLMYQVGKHPRGGQGEVGVPDVRRPHWDLIDPAPSAPLTRSRLGRHLAARLARNLDGEYRVPSCVVAWGAGPLWRSGLDFQVGSLSL